MLTGQLVSNIWWLCCNDVIVKNMIVKMHILIAARVCLEVLFEISNGL